MRKNIVVIGGDERYIELIGQLEKVKNTSIYIVGFGQLTTYFKRAIPIDIFDVLPKKIDIVILPVTGTDNSGQIMPTYSKDIITLNHHWFSLLKKDVKIFTGITKPYLEDITKRNHLKLIPLYYQDEIAKKNAIPTAEGTIKLIIDNIDTTINDTKIMITGYGRIGSVIADKCKMLGADVTVVARDESDIKNASIKEIKAILYKDLLTELRHNKILINTVPSQIITKSEIDKLNSGIFIIDLASPPGGINIEYAKEQGLSAVWARGLPGKTAPKTAGEIMVSEIKKYINL